jgi:cytochrome oxidase Cu insertion factor (SCO1/SenC/PrrC family)
MHSTAFSPRRWLLQGFANMMLLALSLGVVPAQATVDKDFEALRMTQLEEKITAPDFTLTTTAGETLRLSDLKGKVVLLNFWATW